MLQAHLYSGVGSAASASSDDGDEGGAASANSDSGDKDAASVSSDGGVVDGEHAKDLRLLYKWAGARSPERVS